MIDHSDRSHPCIKAYQIYSREAGREGRQIGERH